MWCAVTRKLRRAGAQWRALVHEPKGHSFSISHNPSFGGLVEDSDTYRNVTLPGTEFDELVVGHWIHLEQMDTGRWWMNIGGLTVWVTADRDGRPVNVAVYGPGAYAPPEPGCSYSLTWQGDDEIPAGDRP
jgi:hypothetical protein